MTKKHTWSAVAKSGLIQFPDEQEPEKKSRNYRTSEERIEKQNVMVELAKNEIRGSQIARELGVSYFYVREVLSKAGSLVWLDHQELIELRNSRKNNNTNQ